MRTREKTIELVVREYQTMKKASPAACRALAERLNRLPGKYIDLLEWDLQDNVCIAIRRALTLTTGPAAPASDGIREK